MRIGLIKADSFKFSASKLVMVVVLLEVFLGGGGRLIDVGPLSLRMYFFILTLCLSFIIVINHRPANRYFVALLILSTLLFLVSSIIGFINGASIKLIGNDVKPLLSIYFLLFFYFTIRTESDVDLVIRLVKASAVILAFGYILVFFLINAKLISFTNFYRLAMKSEEFFFRGEFAFFYKGFIYICIGLFFFATENKINKPVVIVLLVAIVLTFTRGFFLSIGLTYIFYLIFIKKSKSSLVLFVAIITLAVLFFWNIVYTDRIDRRDSDSARIIQIKEVIESVTPITVLVGHGFGVGVPSRPERMEIAYLEVFHKQGMLGISFWVLLFLLNLILYGSAVKIHRQQIVVPFLLSVVLIYLESFTNPFLNNPIGLTMILVSLVCLNVLRKSIPISENYRGIVKEYRP